MASNSRRQIETWLKTIDVKGSVIDVGGLFWPVRGRTRTWDVDKYSIIDIKSSRNGVSADLVYDMNSEWLLGRGGGYDNAFCIEVADHFWNPVTAFNNINFFLKKGGLLYLSANFLFPHHTGADYIRFTSEGLQKILRETGFEVVSITPRTAVSECFLEGMKAESKVVRHPNEIGYMVVARKV